MDAPKPKPTMEEVLEFIAARSASVFIDAFPGETIAFVIMTQIGDQNHTVSNLLPEGVKLILEDTLAHQNELLAAGPTQ